MSKAETNWKEHRYIAMALNISSRLLMKLYSWLYQVFLLAIIITVSIFMVLHNDITASEASGIISDSLTASGAFVAIGIPLSLQFIASFRSEFRSPEYIEYLTHNKIISPSTLIGFFASYVIVALLMKSVMGAGEESLDQCHEVMFGIVIGLFVAIMILTAGFYRTIYKRLSKPHDEQINDLIK